MEKNLPVGPTRYAEIGAIRFYILGDEENEKDSAVTITNKEVMRGDIPMPEGIYDAHMGTTDHAWNCLTCGNRKTICPGHFGVIHSRYPLKQPMFREHLLKFLKVICYHCGEPVVALKKHIKPSQRMQSMLVGINKVKECANCKKPHLQVVKDKKRPSIFYRVQEEQEGKITHREEFYNHDILKFVQRIKLSTVKYFGLPVSSAPHNMIIQNIRVPPNTLRPDIRRIGVGGNRSSISDITVLVKMIKEINDKLPVDIPPSEQISMDLREMYANLDMAYYTMIKDGGGGEVKLVTNKNTPPMSISGRFPSKQGRVRRNLMGKRVSNMMRSVITGDSRLRIDELGIPMIHAKNIEIPEYVTKKNIDKLRIYFLNGKTKYPGCSRLIKKSNNNTYRIEHMPADYELQEGDILLRDMIDGDVVNFNRQPSLLFSNITCMKVVVMTTGDTLRLNPSACNMFNADFDGDQMNAIVLCNIMARNEAMNVSRLARWVISPQKHCSLVGAFQDALIGIADFTRDGVKFNKWHAMAMFNDIKTRGIDYNFNKPLYTNRELVSKLLPPINLERSPSIYKPQYASIIKYNPADIQVVIKRGQLISGVLDKATCGQDVMGSMFHIIANEFGSDTALELIYNMQQLVHEFLKYAGYTIGINDINISDEATKEVKRRIAAMIAESYRITDKLNKGKLIAPLGVPLSDFYEQQQLNALSPGDDFVNPIFADIDINNNGMARTILTGSKGKPSNFVAINGAIGVQTINGERFKAQAGSDRTSPYFLRYETNPEASGYVSASFREGAQSRIYPFMAGEARHGLISNALSTSITGYQNRISVKSLETMIVGNLRESKKGENIVQNLYAECGVNPAKVEKVKFLTVDISQVDFEERFHAKAASLDKKFQTKEIQTLLDDEFKQLTLDRELYRRIHMTLEDHNPKEYIMDSSKQMPVNLQRIIEDVLHNYAFAAEQLTSMEKVIDPKYCIDKIKELCDNLGYVYINETQQKRKSKIPAYIETTTTLMKILIRSYLCINKIVKQKIYHSLLDICISRIIISYSKALIDYGTSVGILAAQCVCEPMTQFILDSKHRTGGQGGTKTNEIVRIQEILGAKDTEKMKNPHMLIMVKHEFETTKEKVQEIANHLEMLHFERFCNNIKIFFESYGKPKHPSYKHEELLIKEIEKHNVGNNVPNDLAKWCIRFGINKEELILKSINIETIVLAIRQHHPELYLIYTPENSKDLFIRCYLRSSYFKQTNNFLDEIVIPTSQSVKKVIVRGIDGLISTEVFHAVKTVKKEDGSLEKDKIYGVFAVGTNMAAVLSNPFVDPYRTQSDSIEEMEAVFGIFAARNKIITELVATLPSLNKFHCTIFADEMVYSGTVSSIQKTGLELREKSNTTLRMSFQMPIQVMQEAASQGMTDRLVGISGPLIVGTNPKIGTTFNRVCVNEEFVKENVKNIDDVLEDL
jgi:DNA-directed RNA polymerase II subunit RPB1